MTRKNFGELEFNVLSLFSENQRLSVHDVSKRLNEPYAYTTLMTVLSRLVKKSTLQREKVGRVYIYSATQSKKSSFSHLFETLKVRFFNKKSSALVSYLIEHTDDLTKSDLDEIAAILEKKKREVSK